MKQTLTKRELNALIASNSAQAEQAKLLAMLRHGEIVSGGYKLSNRQQGREPTEEEAADGQVIGFRDCTDEEKLQNAIQTMHRHIQWHRDFSDAVVTMMGAKKIGTSSGNPDDDTYTFEI